MAKLAELKKQIKDFPELPGVYLMYDGTGAVIYVGKAKNLKARVRSYFAGGDVLCHHRTGPNDDIAANSNTGIYNNVTTNPDVISDSNFFGIFKV